jgi:type IV secretory pathway VirB10-like protein
MDETTTRNMSLPSVETPGTGAVPPPTAPVPKPTPLSPTPNPIEVSAHPTAKGNVAEATGIHAVPASGETTSAEMTFASKLPPDHPGLQLEKPQARSLRRGPILAIGAILATTVLIAVAVAFTPKSDKAQAAASTLPDGTSKNVTISDTVANAPGNSADLHPPPKLGPPLHGADPTATPPSQRVGGSALGSQSVHQTIREERAKAFSSPILVDVENPTQDQGLPAAAANAAAAILGGAANTSAAKPDQPAPQLAGGGTVDPNLQQHKSDFLSRDGVNTSTYLNQPVVMPKSPFEIKAGTIIPATLLTAINSDLPGQIIGQVRENVYDTVSGNYLLIPQGSKLLATYDSAVAYGQERVLFCWNRLVRPDGVSISLECMPGADLAGNSGVSDDVNHHWWRIITGVALGTLLSATADRAAGNVTGYQPTVGQLWASNAGGAVNQAGQQITQKNLAIQPTITVRAGYSVNVIVSKDIIFPPYSRAEVSP